MDVLAESLEDSIRSDFDAVLLQLMAARQDQQAKDTPPFGDVWRTGPSPAQHGSSHGAAAVVAGRMSRTGRPSALSGADAGAVP